MRDDDDYDNYNNNNNNNRENSHMGHCTRTSESINVKSTIDLTLQIALYAP
jgi:hypothetical protein